MSVRSDVIRNAVWMFGAEFVDKICGPILIFVFARMFGSIVMGQYSFVMSYVAFAFMLADLGSTVYAIRQCARNPKRLTFYLSHALTMRVILTALALLALGSAFFIDKPSEVLFALLLYALSVALANIQNVFEITFYSRNDLKVIAIGRMIERIVIFAAGITVIFLTKSFVLFVACHLLAQVLHFVWMFFNSRKFARPVFAFDWTVWKRFVIAGIPIALTGFLFFVYFRIDILMISFLRGDQEVGWYSAAYRLLDLVQFFPYILSYSVFPALLQLHKKNQKLADILFTRAARMLLIIAVPITFGMFFLAPLIVSVIYGTDFLQAILALRVIILIVPFLFIDSLFRYVVYTIAKEWQYLVILLALALFNVVMNFLFIPTYGFVAAAWTTLASEAICFVLLARLIHKGGFTLNLKRTLFSLLRALIAAGAAFWIVSAFVHAYIAVLASLFAYALVMFLVEFDEGDKALVREVAGGIGKQVGALYNIVREKGGL